MKIHQLAGVFVLIHAVTGQQNSTGPVVDLGYAKYRGVNNATAGYEVVLID